MPTELVLRNVNAGSRDAVKELSNSRLWWTTLRGAASEYATCVAGSRGAPSEGAVLPRMPVKLERDSLEAHLTRQRR